jgi:hypothetical protein
VFIPVPVRGLHFGKPLIRPFDGYALELSNFIPRNGGLCSRLPMSELNNPAAQPDWMYSYVNGSTTAMIGVAANGTVRRFLPTDAAVVSLTTGITESVGATVNGLLIYTGYPTNPPHSYDGTTDGTPSYTLPASGDWSTLTTSDMTGLCVFKGRVFYWSFKSDELLYTALNAHAGVVSAYPLKNVSDTGGNIKLITRLTMDGGTGPDDLMVIFLDTGEVLIYAGDDPSSAGSFQQAGRFDLPPPVYADSVAQMGPDSVVLTEKGLVPVQAYIKQGFGSPQVDWLDAINPEIESWFKMRTLTIRGRVRHFKRNGFLAVMLGESSSNTAALFVMDTTSKGWTRFAFAHDADAANGTSRKQASMTYGGVTFPLSGMQYSESHEVRAMVEHRGVIYLSARRKSDSRKQVIKYGDTAALTSGDFADTIGRVELHCIHPFAPAPTKIQLTRFMQAIAINTAQIVKSRSYGAMFDGIASEVNLFTSSAFLNSESTQNSEEYICAGAGWCVALTVKLQVWYSYDFGWDQAVRLEIARLDAVPTEQLFANSFEGQPA